jgi:hypothetical protein
MKLLRQMQNIVTDFTIFQIWTQLFNGRLRIPAFPAQRFSEYTRQRNINPLLRNIQAERILPWQRILLTVKRFLSNQIVAMEA